ncbi:FadR family transcriptional regulator [Salicibibacter cibarius]|uniref:FadR family transcriptional regulator n=1 Tax=Salicibibacter cibarius TaxID=2743000 RepID=A0A7T6Z4G0_9BACI|nr:FCD domain-containing protein [Salicibibacter cibarius]QQK76813.1 FadR family transcriptional regulator [Salicibibacter cibarius]
MSRKLSDEILMSLKRKIINKDLAFGQRIPSEFELMNEFQVSRTTIREVIQVLVQAGFVEIRRGKGTFVIYDENEEMLNDADIEETKAMLDEKIVTLACSRRTDEDLERLNQLLKNREQNLNMGNYASYVNEDIAFHLAIAKASHNNTLENLYLHFSGLLRNQLNKKLLSIPDYSANSDIHENIYKAIKNQNQDQAKYWVAENLKN